MPDAALVFRFRLQAAVIHAGDFAYNLDSNDGAVGDRFMEQIEYVAQEVAYMVAAGNHESHQNFSHFTNRFAMPNKASSGNHFYSWDAGLVHFVAYNTEAYGNFRPPPAPVSDTIF